MPLRQQTSPLLKSVLDITFLEIQFGSALNFIPIFFAWKLKEMENHNCSVYVIGILAFVFDNQSCFFFFKKIIYCVYVNIMISTAMFWLLAKNKARCWHFMWTEPLDANHYPCEAQMSKRGTEGLRTLPRIKRKITSEAGISNFWTEKQNRVPTRLCSLMHGA